jgi:hypothetical protein
MQRIVIVIAFLMLGVNTSAQDKVKALQEEIEDFKVLKKAQQKYIAELYHEIDRLKAQVRDQQNAEATPAAHAPRAQISKPRTEPKVETEVVALDPQFYLKDNKTGELYGPYDTAKGSSVHIGNRMFTVVKKELTDLEKKLATMIMPQVDCRNANLHDVLQLLAESTNYLAKDGKGVNFVHGPPKQGPKKDFSVTDEPGGITLRMKNVPILEVLRTMAKNNSLTYKFSGNTVTVFQEQK